jgi:hypothetical protein
VLAQPIHVPLHVTVVRHRLVHQHLMEPVHVPAGFLGGGAHRVAHLLEQLKLLTILLLRALLLLLELLRELAGPGRDAVHVPDHFLRLRGLLLHRHLPLHRLRLLLGGAAALRLLRHRS